MVIEITDWKNIMNEPEDDIKELGIQFVTEKYREQLQDEIKPKHFIYALLMAEEYKRDGFTFDGFIAELKSVIMKSMPDYNIKLSYDVDKLINNIRLYTDIVRDIANSN